MRAGRLAEQLRERRVPLVSRDELGESPWPPTLAVLTAAGLYATLPTRLVAGSSAGVFGVARWIVPALAIALLVPLVLSVPRVRVVESMIRRAGACNVGRRLVSLAVIAIISAANAAAIMLLVHLLVIGETKHARELLRAAIHLWCMNVLVFALWFWELDSGGPVARRSQSKGAPDFLFPQQEMPELEPRWQPSFVDYLYVSFTNATAFSPTDTMPLSQWAKMLMLAQSAASLLLALMVAARAINILR